MLIEGNICSEQEHLPQAKCLSAVAVCMRNNRMQTSNCFYCDKDFMEMACWVDIPCVLDFHTTFTQFSQEKLEEVGGGGKETLQMIRDDAESLKLGYLS